MNALPAVIETDEGSWRVRRAWPEEDGMVFEAGDARRLVGGRWDARRGATVVDPLHDRRLPGLAELPSSSAVISYRPGKRAVAHCTERGTYTKVVRPGRAQRVLDGVERGAVFASSFATPRVLGSDDASVTFAAVAGLTVHDLAPQIDGAEWQQLWRDWGQRWVAATQGSSTAPVHGPAEEAAVVRTWHAHLERWAGLDPTFADAVDRVTEALVAGSVEPFVPAHRDLHDKQLLWDGAGGFGLLDVDTACRAEAALDLGNLRAHALLRGMQGVYRPGQVRVARAAVDAAAGQLGVTQQRLALYERAAVLRLGCVYAFRPAWRSLAATLRNS